MSDVGESIDTRERYAPKVGDRVRVASSPVPADQCAIGKTVVITDIDEKAVFNHYFVVAEDDNDWLHRDTVFEPVAEPDPANPKDAIGSRKTPFMVIPERPQAELGLALLEGACKYGRHNFRASTVRASVYYDALRRHLAAWVEGEDLDPDSGIPHLMKAAACLVILRDAELCGTLIDDRPPSKYESGWMHQLNQGAERILAKFPEPKAAYTKERA